MELFKKIQSSTLFKVTSLNGISVLVKIAIGLVTSKVLAVFIGPGGMALVGNLRNFLTSVESVSSLGFQNGIVKYVAENDKQEPGLKRIVSTLFISLLVVTLAIGCVLFFLAEYWNQKIFGSQLHYAYVFKITAVTLPFYIASLYLVAIINGLGKFTKVIYINILGNIIGLLVTLFFVWKLMVPGALLAIIITPSLLFFVSLYFISGEISLKQSLNFRIFDLGIFKNLSHYLIMAMVSGILGPLVLLMIRNHVIDTIGLKEAGFWEAVYRISTYYLLFVNTLLTVYYYPKLVVAKDHTETKSVIWDFYKNVLPLFAVGLLVVYCCRGLIIKILFSRDFEPVSDLFFWQLAGDFLKSVSWILALQFFAKKMTKAFIVTEILSLSIQLLSSFYFVNVFGVEGVVMAHAFTYFAYLIVLGIYFRKNLFS
ncbi:O-antigen translocase [Flavobacterium humi]|uniref:O-antigen translocase n=1 Tax=Flavobacterium humi TaxID=2562683 RepID=A0A4Z0LA82_9FLAO|nr:O-antigen translocase [Flavobacterium humi]TGD58159.1 O-antigen translocase [Flavobacterium humi]